MEALCSAIARKKERRDGNGFVRTASKAKQSNLKGVGKGRREEAPIFYPSVWCCVGTKVPPPSYSLKKKERGVLTFWWWLLQTTGSPCVPCVWERVCVIHQVSLFTVSPLAQAGVSTSDWPREPWSWAQIKTETHFSRRGGSLLSSKFGMDSTSTALSIFLALSVFTPPPMFSAVHTWVPPSSILVWDFLSQPIPSPFLLLLPPPTQKNSLGDLLTHCLQKEEKSKK